MALQLLMLPLLHPLQHSLLQFLPMFQQTHSNFVDNEPLKFGELLDLTFSLH
jgi:hypothetical protein